MTTTELAERLLFVMRPHLYPYTYDEQKDLVFMLTQHLDAYHAELVRVISMNATNLLPPDATHKTSSPTSKARAAH